VVIRSAAPHLERGQPGDAERTPELLGGVDGSRRLSARLRGHRRETRRVVDGEDHTEPEAL
jgi:hypothetical protein